MQRCVKECGAKPALLQGRDADFVTYILATNRRQRAELQLRRLLDELRQSLAKVGGRHPMAHPMALYGVPRIHQQHFVHEQCLPAEMHLVCWTLVLQNTIAGDNHILPIEAAAQSDTMHRRRLLTLLLLLWQT